MEKGIDQADYEMCMDQQSQLRQVNYYDNRIAMLERQLEEAIRLLNQYTNESLHGVLLIKIMGK